jgi:hypothetical protein
LYVIRRASSISVAMSASLNWMAWCVEIGRPKERRRGLEASRRHQRNKREVAA